LIFIQNWINDRISQYKAVLSQDISSYRLLKNAEKIAVASIRIDRWRYGIHWPLLDEDLSLKGFLQDELRKVVKK